MLTDEDTFTFNKLRVVTSKDLEAEEELSSGSSKGS